MSLPLLHLSGGPYRQGFEHGRLLQKSIKHNLELYFERFERGAHLGREEVLRRARLYLEAMRQGQPDYAEGMRGIAAGSGAELLEIAALNVRYELLYDQSGALTLAPDGCTAFAITPEASANGHLLLGQSWDWIPGVQGAVLHAQETDGLETLSFSEAGIFGGKIGLNSAGLGLLINGLSTTDDNWERLTKPFHVRCYEMLRSWQLEDAASVISGEARACSSNFLLAQRPDRAVDIEAAPNTLTLRQPENGLLLHANHFLEPDKTGIREPPGEHPDSRHRQARLRTLLTGPLTLEALQDVLRDHDGYPDSICRHPDRGTADGERYATVAAIVMDLHEGVMTITDGPPCGGEFIRLEVFGDSQP